ncbi:MAG: hypothetical protein COB50_02285 [Thiotrichales bacterium]|nr:MAG: hypothetical protein COB50_02285 [Thiotrichales bacterium]
MQTSIPNDAIGLGLRREFLHKLSDTLPEQIGFLEITPENWLHVGGWRAKKLQVCLDRYPTVCHGLSLSLGATTPLDTAFVADMREFLLAKNILYYSEHLSYCSDANGQLYDLLPMPLTEEAAIHMAERISQVQDILKRRISVENISYYCTPHQEMSEEEFINLILKKADCKLLLDVNNVYVNSINHKYDAKAFIKSLPKDKISYLHISGHDQVGEDLIIDTHGDDVVAPVWELLQFTYQTVGVLPTLLERDNNVPKLDSLLQEMNLIRDIQNKVCSNA